ncbi:MAG: glycosyltransferase family 2 protein, partial [Muribaculaceae bacterium]|nr:glycosyltransferase family 2 protein [Muribaculaceae bacterium]
MGTTTTLQVAIPTHTPEGIERIGKLLLPRQEGVGYVVSWQDHRGAPVPEGVTARDDVEIHRFEGAGLSANRNNALAHCRADIILIGDDDLVYRPDAFDNIRETFERHPEVDYASFRYDSPDRKPYPAAETPLSHIPKGFYQTTFEIALRRQSPAGTLRFSGLFGPGAPYLTAGEDEFFLLTAVRKGVNCRYFPLTIAEHPTLTSGSLPKSPTGLLRTTGALIALRHRLMWVP